MANPEHVAVVRKGAASIEEWRQNHPKETLNLFQADLRSTNLSNADLHDADLIGAILIDSKLCRANLSKADFAWANLLDADLSGANLSGSILGGSYLSQVNLSKADLSGADLRLANLSAANLSEADLSGAKLQFASLPYVTLLETNLSDTDLKGTQFVNILDSSNVNLTNAKISGTTFVSCNLASYVGLETVKHEGPCYIDFNTLLFSFWKAGKLLKPEIKTFALKSGLPKELIDELPRILTEVKYCTCFVCYGQPDLNFAKRLREHLIARGVPCWLYSMDATPGSRTWREIARKRREAEKMIVVCSAEALVRDGVLKEIEEQIDEDRDKIVPISLDNLWKAEGFMVKRGQRDLKPFLLERNYADFSHESMYDESLNRLLTGIKRT